MIAVLPVTKTRVTIRVLLSAALIIMAVGGAGTFAAMSSGSSLQGLLVRPRSAPPSPRCTDFFRCELMNEIQKTHRFLQRHKDDQPYTPDPRPLTPYSEVVRLNIDTQAHGYLNLYELTGKNVYRKEAQQRLDYILGPVSQALGGGPFNGMIGYTFLEGFRLTGKTEYRDFGLRVADACLGYANLKLNGGLMCGMVLGRAYRLTDNQQYLTKLRQITAATASKQNLVSGAFPHVEGGPPNAPYSAWMAQELFFIRQDDQQNPDSEAPLLRLKPFLMKRVNADGSLNYADADGEYWRDAGYDTRYWISALSSFASALQSYGERDAAQRILQFLFRQQLTGSDAGSYPDKWTNVNPDNLWESGRPSVVRTSMVFWDLTTLALNLRKTGCQSGAAVSCEITPSNCNAEFAELQGCNAGYSGTNTCLNGQWTQCINPSLIRYQKTVCPGFYYDCRDYPPCVYTCHFLGPQKCIGNQCTQCVDETAEIQCDDVCDEDIAARECRQ